MLAVFDNLYLSKLKNEYIGYATRSTMDIIKHIYEHYARISPSDMAANDEILRASYNTEEPLESLVERPTSARTLPLQPASQSKRHN